MGSSHDVEEEEEKEEEEGFRIDTHPPFVEGYRKSHSHGRRHGFESGGQFWERSEQKKFLTPPPLFGQWGDKILLR